MSKKNNARIQKWRNMVKQNILHDPILLQSRIRKGIPAAIRPVAWPYIIKLDQFIKKHQNQYNYSKLINSPSKSTYQIGLDIPRTFPEEEDTKILRKSLNNVLKAISIVYPKVGYCQGMNFLALRLLQIIQDQQTFWILYYLFDKDKYLMKNFIEPKKIQQQSYVFSQLMKEFTPTISAVLQKQNIVVQIFTIKWFMTIFSSVFSQELFYRVFEVYLNEGWSFLYTVGLTLLRINQKKIKQNSFQNNLFLLNSQITHIKDINQFMQEVCKLQIPQQTIQLHTSKYIKQQEQKSLKKQGQMSRNSTLVNIRQNQKLSLPIPQDQNSEQIQFQSKSQEITFEVLRSLKEQTIKNNY